MLNTPVYYKGGTTYNHRSALLIKVSGLQLNFGITKRYNEYVWLFKYVSLYVSRMHMCACMYACIIVYMYICMQLCMHECSVCIT